MMKARELHFLFEKRIKSIEDNTNIDNQIIIFLNRTNKNLTG